MLALLRRVLPVDALWWATSDPATLLFTQAFREGIPDRTIPYLVDNEFLGRDVNQWTELAQHHRRRALAGRATGGSLEASARFRDVFQPLGLGDELRAVLRTGDDCWGLLCLHRAAGSPFSDEETQFVQQLAPHLGYGIRAGLLVASAVEGTAADRRGSSWSTVAARSSRQPPPHRRGSPNSVTTARPGRRFRPRSPPRWRCSVGRPARRRRGCGYARRPAAGLSCTRRT